MYHTKEHKNTADCTTSQEEQKSLKSHMLLAFVLHNKIFDRVLGSKSTGDIDSLHIYRDSVDLQLEMLASDSY